MCLGNDLFLSSSYLEVVAFLQYIRMHPIHGCIFRYFVKLGKFLTVLQVISLLVFFPSPSGTPTVYMLVSLMVSHRSLGSVHFFSFFFPVPQS